jgi:hypothetical protein
MRQLTSEEVIYRTYKTAKIFFVPSTGSCNLQFKLPNDTWVNDGDPYTQSESVSLDQGDVQWRVVLNGAATAYIDD